MSLLAILAVHRCSDVAVTGTHIRVLPVLHMRWVVFDVVGCAYGEAV